MATPGYGSVTISVARSRCGDMAHSPPLMVDVRRFISPSLSQSIRRWPGWAPRSVISPPAMPTAARNTAVSMRSDTGVWSTGTSGPPTPLIVIVWLPAPSTSAPMRFRNAARSAISGSRAALSMTVRPSAAVAAIMMFSVAPTLGQARETSSPLSTAARACT